MSQSAEPIGPVWLQYAWTFVFAMVVAACFTVAGFLMFGQKSVGGWHSVSLWGENYLGYLTVTLVIAYSIQGLFKLAHRLLGPARMQRLTSPQRWLFFSGIPIVGVIVGNVIGAWLLGDSAQFWGSSGEPNSVLGSVLFAGLTWFLFSVYFSGRTKRILAERRAAQAQLQLLQAQMEPHFLFNTLANVVSLMDADTPRAKAMLESFTDYLRASLGSLRAPEHALADELALVAAYLSVVKVRMDDRLRYRIAVPDELRACRVPALSLQPLVENAVVHGLEPSIDGGQLLITAERDASGRLLLRVTDDGLGLSAVPRPAHRLHQGSGTALANIRERLRQTHGDSAHLLIEPAVPHGVRASLTLPMTTFS